MINKKYINKFIVIVSILVVISIPILFISAFFVHQARDIKINTVYELNHNNFSLDHIRISYYNKSLVISHSINSDSVMEFKLIDYNVNILLNNEDLATNNDFVCNKGNDHIKKYCKNIPDAIEALNTNFTINSEPMYITSYTDLDDEKYLNIIISCKIKYQDKIVDLVKVLSIEQEKKWYFQLKVH